jgi:hypothetical protein
MIELKKKNKIAKIRGKLLLYDKKNTKLIYYLFNIKG